MGIPDVDWLAERISGQQLREWADYETEYGPILVHERVDIAGALIAMHIVGDPQKPLGDFLPDWNGRGREERMLKAIIAFKDAHKRKQEGEE